MRSVDGPKRASSSLATLAPFSYGSSRSSKMIIVTRASGLPTVRSSASIRTGEAVGGVEDGGAAAIAEALGGEASRGQPKAQGATRARKRPSRTPIGHSDVDVRIG